MNDNSYKVIEIDINEILPNRFQPRIQFDEEEILELSDSIKEHGVIQPIVVRTIGDKYEIIAGERRYKASVLAGKDTVPVIIKNLDDKDSAEIALIENIQRKNLTPIEEALSYKKILDMGYITQEGLATKLGKSQSSVANKIRLLNLSDEVQEALLDNKISERHARSLLRLKSTIDQNEMLEKIISERLTVRKTDAEIDKILNPNIEEEIEEEKGEIEMNSDINQISNETTPEIMNTFDIFGDQNGAGKIDFSNIQPTIEPVAPAIEVPAMPAAPVAPAIEVPQTTLVGIQFDANGNVISGGASVPMTTPIEEVAVNEAPQTTLAGIQFDANGNVISGGASVPVTAPIEEAPAAPVIETPIITEAVQPISIETPIETPSTIADAVVMPEPIIVTDYNKQYDPLMPEQNVAQFEKTDFKEVINLIRDCSKKIEQYGYYIDVEEYDLSSTYQVVLKIEK